VTLAAVRPLDLVVRRAIEGYQYRELERQFGVLGSRVKPKVTQFLERLFNNNEPEYFYLHRQPELGLPMDCCAILQVSIALRADLHYNTLLAAKILQLQESFEHKLGYLVGTTYSRVGTADWVPDHMTEKAFQKRIDDLLNSSSLVTWVDDNLLNKALDDIKNLAPEEQTIERFEAAVARRHSDRAARKQQALDALVKAAADLQMDPALATKLRSRLENDPVFSATIR
jgi:hypothetical protein